METFLNQQPATLLVNNVEINTEIKPLEDYYELKPTSILKDEELSLEQRILEIEQIAQQQENEFNERLNKDRYREQDFYFMGDPTETDEVKSKIPDFVKQPVFLSKRNYLQVLDIRGWANLPIEFLSLYQIQVEIKPKDFEFFPLIRIDKIKNSFLYKQLKKEKIREVRPKIENSLYNISAVKLLTQENVEKRAQIYAKLFVRNVKKKQEENFFFEALPQQDSDFGEDSQQIPTQQELSFNYYF